MSRSAFALYRGDVLLAKSRPSGAIVIYHLKGFSEIEGRIYKNKKLANAAVCHLAGEQNLRWHIVSPSVRDPLTFAKTKIGCLFLSQAASFSNRH